MSVWFRNGSLRRALVVSIVGLGLSGVGYAAGDWVQRVNADHERLALVAQTVEDRTVLAEQIPDIATDVKLLAQGQAILREAQNDIRTNMREQSRQVNGRLDDLSSQVQGLIAHLMNNHGGKSR